MTHNSPAPHVPVHLQNVHAALSADAVLDRLAAAEAATAAALAETRRLQSAFVVAAFDEAERRGATPMGTNDATEAIPARMHTLFTGDGLGAECERLETVLVPPHATPQQTLLLQTRLLCNDNVFWEKLPAGFRRTFQTHLRDPDAFIAGWETVEGGALHRAFPGEDVHAFITETPLTHCDDTHTLEDVHLARAARSLTHCLWQLDMPARTAIMHVKCDAGCATLRFETCPCAPDGSPAHDLARDVFLPRPTRAPAAAEGKTLAVLCTGLQHDDMFSAPERGLKHIATDIAPALVHPRFGVHETQAARLAMPHLLQTAHNIGEIHLMTQIAKALLRSRPEKDSHVAALTVEQKGAHLRNEERLCAYWEAVQAALDPAEARCLRSAVQHMRDAGTLSYRARTGRLCSSPAPVFDLATRSPARSLHHVEVTVHIKGALAVPCATLGRAEKRLAVRVDNNWVLESHVACLP
eukprot:3935449-Rhodomonas_salina.1